MLSADAGRYIDSLSPFTRKPIQSAASPSFRYAATCGATARYFGLASKKTVFAPRRRISSAIARGVSSFGNIIFSATFFASAIAPAPYTQMLSSFFACSFSLWTTACRFCIAFSIALRRQPASINVQFLRFSSFLYTRSTRVFAPASPQSLLSSKSTELSQISAVFARDPILGIRSAAIRSILITAGKETLTSPSLVSALSVPNLVT